MAAKWERELTCAICQDLFNNPKILPCLHSFCTGCLKAEWSGKLANLDPSKRHLECPLCRAKILLSTSRAVEELPSHLSAIRLVESLREQANSKKVTPTCQNCDEGENAVSMCSDCAIFLCQFCAKSHQIGKASKCHKIQSLDEKRKGDVDVSSVLPEKFEMCPTHPTKPLELYCKCEEVLLCRDCIIKKHEDHDYDVISDVVDGERKILKEALPGIQQLVDEMENAVSRVKWRREDVEGRKTENLHKLDDIFQSLHAALDERQRQIRVKLTDDSKEKDRVLQVQENDLCFLLSQLKSCHSFIEDKIERGVNQDVLAMKRSMLERRDKLKELKNKTKSCPVVKSQHPLHLKQVGKVMKLISQLE